MYDNWQKNTYETKLTAALTVSVWLGVRERGCKWDDTREAENGKVQPKKGITLSLSKLS